MGYYYGHPMMYGYWGAGDIIGHVITFAIILAIVVIVLRWAFGGGRMRRMHRWQMMHGMDGNSALDVLKERYAKGEIDKKEFEEKKKDLE